MVTASPAIAVHTKACFEALGSERASAVLAEAQVDTCIVWAGENGEYLGGADQCRRRGLSVLSVSCPKMCALGSSALAEIDGWSRNVIAAGAPAVGLIFGDRLDRDDDAARLVDHFALWAEQVPLAIVVENNGQRGEYFSSMSALSKLLRRARNVQVALDLGHLACTGGYAGDLSAIVPRVAWVEVHDNDGQHDSHLPLGLGSGAGSYRTQLAALRMVPKTVVIETNPRLGPSEAEWVSAIRNDVQALRERLAMATEARSDEVV